MTAFIVFLWIYLIVGFCVRSGFLRACPFSNSRTKWFSGILVLVWPIIFPIVSIFDKKFSKWLAK